ncbi:MAG: DUF6273 domain-containing protein [Coriobacteriales bacterium]|nr:DUF6273 domain-containing protein [Coriobacteriales bacterium]
MADSRELENRGGYQRGAGFSTSDLEDDEQVSLVSAEEEAEEFVFVLTEEAPARAATPSYELPDEPQPDLLSDADVLLDAAISEIISKNEAESESEKARGGKATEKPRLKAQGKARGERRDEDQSERPLKRQPKHGLASSSGQAEEAEIEEVVLAEKDAELVKPLTAQRRAGRGPARATDAGIDGEVGSKASKAADRESGRKAAKKARPTTTAETGADADDAIQSEAGIATDAVTKNTDAPEGQRSGRRGAAASATASAPPDKAASPKKSEKSGKPGKAAEIEDTEQPEGLEKPEKAAKPAKRTRKLVSEHSDAAEPDQADAGSQPTAAAAVAAPAASAPVAAAVAPAATAAANTAAAGQVPRRFFRQVWIAVAVLALLTIANLVLLTVNEFSANNAGSGAGQSQTVGSDTGVLSIGNVEVGDVVRLGQVSFEAAPSGQFSDNIRWRVLAVEGGRALLITEEVIDFRGYQDKLEATTWETSDIRAWLNDEFYNGLPDIIRARIMATELSNPANSSTGIDGGNDTTDKVFLLSIGEAEQYFKNDNARIAKLNIAEDTLADFNQQYSGDTTKKNGEATAWRLRSPGKETNTDAAVSSKGEMVTDGLRVDGGKITGIRPAFWIAV